MALLSRMEALGLERAVCIFFSAWLTLLGASFVGIFRVTRGELLAARLMYSFLWLFTIIPISWFLAFCAAVDGAAVMP